MELAKIEKLLEKYFEGETNVQEEQLLQAYFNTSNVAPHLVEYQPLFQYFSVAQNETFTKELTIQPRKSYSRWLAIASVFVVGMSVYFTMHFQQQRQEKEVLLAFEETKEALNLLSKRFNNGVEKVAYLNEFEQTKNQVFKNK